MTSITLQNEVKLQARLILLANGLPGAHVLDVESAPRTALVPAWATAEHIARISCCRRSLALPVHPSTGAHGRPGPTAAQTVEAALNPTRDNVSARAGPPARDHQQQHRRAPSVRCGLCGN